MFSGNNMGNPDWYKIGMIIIIILLIIALIWSFVRPQ